MRVVLIAGGGSLFIASMMWSIRRRHALFRYLQDAHLNKSLRDSDTTTNAVSDSVSTNGVSDNAVTKTEKERYIYYNTSYYME